MSLSIQEFETIIEMNPKIELLHLKQRIDSKKLSFDECEYLCNLINGEFLMKGIKENFEPNEYGIYLENILDKVNRSRLK